MQRFTQSFHIHMMNETVSQPCHLLSIAPELRLLIFEFVLQHSHDECPDQHLLQTCKQIYHEAKDLIYTNGTFDIHAKFETIVAFSKADRYTKVQIKGPGIHIPGCGRYTPLFVNKRNNPMSVLQFSQVWPRHLLHCSDISLKLEIADGYWPRVDDAASFNHLLFSFVAVLLRTANMKRKVRIKLAYFGTDESWGPMVLRKALYPMERIPWAVDLVLVGFAKQHEESIQHARWLNRETTGLSSFNVLYEWGELKKAGIDELYRLTDKMGELRKGESDVERKAVRARRVLGSVNGMLVSKRYFISGHGYRRLIHLVAWLRDYVSDGGLRSLPQLDQAKTIPEAKN